jgi:hypothetical protein
MESESRLAAFSSERVARWSALAALAVLACLMPASADTYWHLRAGQDIARSGQVSLVDRYSYSAAGSPWPDHEWLWQIFSYELHSLGGMVLLTAAAASFLLAAFWLAQDLAVGPWWTKLALFVTAVLLSGPPWSVRPQMLTLLALMAVTWLLVRGKPWALPPVFLAWANAHGAVMLGLVVAAAAFGVAAARGERRRALGIAIASAISAALTLATPLGPRLWAFIGESTARSRLDEITEWRSGFVPVAGSVMFWIAAAALVIASLRLWRRLPGFADQLLVAAALCFIPLGFYAVRNIGPFALLALPASSRLWAVSDHPRAAALSERLRALFGGAPAEAAEPASVLRRNRRNLAAIAVIGVAVVGWCWSHPPERLNWAPVSPAAAAAIRACPGRVYNEYNEGGYLIWFVPESPVFIDGRQDPYALAFLRRAQLIASDAVVRAAVFAEHDIRCAALSPDARLVPRLRAASWRETYRDARWVVLAR